VNSIKKNNLIKSIVKTLVYIIVLFVVLFSIGVAYTWYMSKDVVNVNSDSLDYEIDPKPKIIHPTISPDAPVGASIQSISSPVKLGDEVSLIVKTRPFADCSVVLEYDKAPIEVAELVPNKADDFGTVKWIWSILGESPVGKWPVKINCKYGDKSGYVEGELFVKS